MDISACRLCLTKEDLAPLFGKPSSAQFTRNEVFLTTGVVILPSDSLPQVACKTCIERIKSALHLRNISTQTQNKLQQMYPKINITFEKGTSEKLLYEIENFTTNNEDLNKFMNNINGKVSKFVDSLTYNSQHDISDVDNEFITNYSHLDNESEISQTDNHEFDHNYYQKLTWDGITKYEKRENLKPFNSIKKEVKLISKLRSRIKKTRFKANPAMLPARKFKQLFLSLKKNETQTFKAQNTTKNYKNGQKNTKTKRACKITKIKNLSQYDNKINQSDNKLSQPDNYNNYEEDIYSFKLEEWDENQLKEMEVQKHIDKKRQEKFMSLAVSPYPINGRLQCKVCLHSLARHGFVSHAKRHFPPEFACETCGKMFYCNSHLQYHQQRMHGQVKPLACPLCDYRAVWKQDLTGHMRIHTGERPYVCDVCAGSFRVRADIVQHMRTHFGVKHIQCPRCPNKWFRCLSDVAKHNRRIHHNFTYFCHLCPKTYHGYGGRSSVRKHLSKIHGIPRSEQPIKLKYTKIPKPDEFQHEKH